MAARREELKAEFKTVTLEEGATRTLDFGRELTARVIVEWTGKVSPRLGAVCVPGRVDLTAATQPRELLEREDMQVQLMEASTQATFDTLKEGEWTVFVIAQGGFVGRAIFTVVRGQELRLSVAPAAAK